MTGVLMSLFVPAAAGSCMHCHRLCHFWDEAPSWSWYRDDAVLLSVLKLFCVAQPRYLDGLPHSFSTSVIWYSHPFLHTLSGADHLHNTHIMKAACTGLLHVRGMWSFVWH